MTVLVQLLGKMNQFMMRTKFYSTDTNGKNEYLKIIKMIRRSTLYYSYALPIFIDIGNNSKQATANDYKHIPINKWYLQTEI